MEPRNSAVYTELGTIALARHDFRGGLEYGLKARRLAPDTVKPLGVIVDGQVELGRYDDAARTLQTMLDEKPNLRGLRAGVVLTASCTGTSTGRSTRCGSPPRARAARRRTSPTCAR